MLIGRGGREPMARLLGTLVLAAALLVSLAACSPETEMGSRTTAGNHAPDASVSGGETTAASAPATWDYVALGDSLAAGVGAQRGYVERYAEHVRIDTGARVRVVNLGVSGQTSAELLGSLREDRATRGALRGAEVITLNIGINDLGRAGEAYENGACGGADNEECLRAAVEEVKGNWDEIVAEVSSLRPVDGTIIRTAGLGYVPRVGGVYGPYLDDVNRHIATTATESGIPYAEVHLGEEGMSPDGVHPNDAGYEVIARELRGLGYGPLSPR
jgi:lysophospholipase L1-like esterase